MRLLSFHLLGYFTVTFNNKKTQRCVEKWAYFLMIFLVNYFLYVMRKLKSFKTKMKLILGRKGDVTEHGSIYFFLKKCREFYKRKEYTYHPCVYIIKQAI